MRATLFRALVAALAVCTFVSVAAADPVPFTVTCSANTADLAFTNQQFSMKIQDGRDFSFNCTGCNLVDGTTYNTSTTGGALFGSYLDVTIGSTTYLSYFTTKVAADTKPGGLGPFDYSLTQITPLLWCDALGTTCTTNQYSGSVTSVDSLHLILAAGTFAPPFAVHVCDSGTPGTPSSPGCTGTTYFQDSIGNIAIDTPEPASLALFSTGLLGLAGWFRRKRQP